MFVCVKCDKSFKTNQKLERHNNKKLPCVKNIIQCLNCFKIFSSFRDLDRHNNRIFKCKRIMTIEDENIKLKEQLELLKSQVKHINIVNDFGDEKWSRIDNNIIELSFNKIINNQLVNIQAKYIVDSFQYDNNDITEIDIFRMFIRIIFNNNKFPENKTLLYRSNKFYYYSNCELFQQDIHLLFDLIFKRIQIFIQDKRFILSNHFKMLNVYVGNNYNISDNIIDRSCKTIITNNINQKNKFIKILELEYKNKFNLHIKNLIIT